ncbi:uncharacterized protein LOC131254116 [Magnolia sinica]|uniref:uncharacterized protein LOC131254116 n=1 Tax=Magnolia sinica TaxID=86752 RepID=UPI0026594361|nr:uncharacterized protein LOC131254116 [Magnolia sinica]
MGFGALRIILRPLSQKAHLTRAVLSHFPSVGTSPLPSDASFRSVLGSLQNNSITPLPWTVMMMRWNGPSMGIHSLTETRFPKRRPGAKPRRKRASLKPPGPYAWVQYVPGEPIPRSRPNEGSVQGRNRIKRIKQHKAFIKSEAKKRKAQVQEAKRKKYMKRIERKMAAVARERAWAERLAELQKLEAEAKKKTEA